MQLDRFREAMVMVQRYLQRLVLRRVGQELAADRVRAAPRLLGGRVLHLAEGGMPWTRGAGRDARGAVRAVPGVGRRGPEASAADRAREGRIVRSASRPATGRAGLRDAQLAAVTGVPDVLVGHMQMCSSQWRGVSRAR